MGFVDASVTVTYNTARTDNIASVSRVRPGSFGGAVSLMARAVGAHARSARAQTAKSRTTFGSLRADGDGAMEFSLLERFHGDGELDGER